MPARIRLIETGWDASLAHEALERWPAAPTGREVLVEVEACGVCHRDLIDRAGRFAFQVLPITPGHEVVGRVVAVGPEVRERDVGDRVATMHRDACGECDRCRAGETSLCGSAGFVLGILADGGYATHLVVPESALYAVPDALPAPEAAVLHCTFGTAYRDLVTLGRLEPGERLLVTGANGGVGAAAVQIGARMGARVVAVVRDERRRAFVESLGAHEVVVSTDGAFHKQTSFEPVDLALDTVGVTTFHSALRSLRIGGRMVVVGNVVEARAELNLGFLITRGLSIVGGSGATRREMAAVLALHEARPFAVPIAATLPLERADEAQRRVRAGGLEGRVVLVPGSAR